MIVVGGVVATVAAKVAATAVVGSLAFCSGRNMLQTWQFMQHVQVQQQPFQTSIPHYSSISSNSRCGLVAPVSVQSIQAMKRRDLLELFAASQPPESLSELEGPWNGVLLQNNGFVMTQVTDVLTNGLFGGGRAWNGKVFSTVQQLQRGNKGTTTGANRFIAKQQQQQSATASSIETKHTFDCSLQPSRLRDGKQSVLLQYHPYQPRFSLWHTMKDELRVVELAITESDNDSGVPKQQQQQQTSPTMLIGLGSMTWSGGIFNASPFCLWRDDGETTTITTTTSATN